jgi:predicted AlkP superfamily pyrophosphatase or phosphodiesterase
MSNRYIFCLIFLISMRTQTSRGAVNGIEHVIVIGLDGMCPDGIRHASTPNLHKLMKEGSWSLHARAVMPTSSSPNWASMIMGAGPEQHGVTSNDWMPDRFDITPTVTGPGGIFPTIFGVLASQRPGSKIAVFHDWKDFARLLETNTPQKLLHVKDALETVAESIKYIEAEKPNFLFIHLDGVDHAGHGFGWRSTEYYKEVEMIDALIGSILQSIEETGIAKNTLVLVTADHGGLGKKHGGNSMEELEIPWILRGPGVHIGKELKTTLNTYDTAPTIAYIFGLQTPDCWIGKPVLEAFEQSGQTSGRRTNPTTGVVAGKRGR